MHKNRLEAFSDGVMAILITIMILEIKVPEGHELADLKPLTAPLLAYLMSFIFLGIYWHNHHHLMQAVKRVNGKILWANSHLLFWLSLVPVGTLWMGESHFATTPTAIYGVMLCGAGFAYFLLTRSLVAHHGDDSHLAKALGSDIKGKASLLIYLAAIGLAFVHPYIAVALYLAVEVMWLVPDARIEKILLSGSE
ncbi:MAG: TMEM175 family protein [Gemmatimonadota bacterium]|nr:TMEM175 family protein [Gemmatimonadota bacterium]